MEARTAKGLKSKFYLLVTSPILFTEKVEERQARDVNGNDLMKICVDGYTQTGHRKPVLSGKQKNAVSDEMNPFMDADIQTTAPPNASIIREIKHEGTWLYDVNADRRSRFF